MTQPLFGNCTDNSARLAENDRRGSPVPRKKTKFKIQLTPSGRKITKFQRSRPEPAKIIALGIDLLHHLHALARILFFIDTESRKEKRVRKITLGYTNTFTVKKSPLPLYGRKKLLRIGMIDNAKNFLKEHTDVAAEIEKIIRDNADRLLAAGKKGTVKPVEVVKPVAAPAAEEAPAEAAPKTTGSEDDLDIMVDE